MEEDILNYLPNVIVRTGHPIYDLKMRIGHTIRSL